MSDDQLDLAPWTGPWEPDDKDANFKADVALYAAVDPLTTLRGLSRSTGIPVGALARYVLAKYATSGSGGLLELGPVMVHRLWEPIERAEVAGTPEAREDAYQALKAMIAWLRVPLVDEAVYRPSGEADEG
jgi:hypothetical protein